MPVAHEVVRSEFVPICLLWIERPNALLLSCHIYFTLIEKHFAILDAG